MEESNIFIEQMLHEIRTGEMTIKDAATEVVSFHTEQLYPELFYGIRKALEKQRILGCVVYQLISLEKNTEYLENRPHNMQEFVVHTHRLSDSTASEACDSPDRKEFKVLTEKP